jgi:glycosyltransferase involved in cell wall biosynthesis
MKVVTSCLTRFWIFDQAFQLHRLGFLHKLIQGYPKRYTRKWLIPDDKVTTCLLNGLLIRIVNALPPFFQSLLMEFCHENFGSILAKTIPKDADVFIGLSSFSLEAIKQAKKMGIISIVDHGSLHLDYENELMKIELTKLGLNYQGRIAEKWIIDRENLEFKLADYIMVLSQKARETLIDKGASPQKIFVNSCGVDISTFKPFPAAAKNKFMIVYCGSITPRKGLHYLLQAFHEMNLPNSELLIIGNISDLEYFEKLKKYQSKSIIFNGPCPQSDLPRLYSKGSIFVLPSIADGFGMVVTQALACGLPTIISSNVGAKDIITEGLNGYVIAPGDIQAMKNRIIRLYSNEKLLKNMSLSALETSVKNMTWDAYGDRLGQFLTSKLMELKVNRIAS